MYNNNVLIRMNMYRMNYIAMTSSVGILRIVMNITVDEIIYGVILHG